MPYQINQIVAFGDSFTEGCGIVNGNYKEYAYCNLVSNMLNVPGVNKGKGGASNLEILTSILSFNFKEGDMVLIGWTYPKRDIIFKKSISRKFNPIEHTRLHVHADEETVVNWLKLHHDCDFAIRSGMYIHHADLYLKSLGLKFIHFFVLHDDWYIRLLKKDYPKWLRKPESKFHIGLFPRLDLGVDGSHPGIESQKKLSKNLLQLIKEECK